ncbi:hypothetical protein O181_009293 [Austropuccinia psidii MF-1]|uniref:Uncharacterized protein n=1 Tax=Austropuccinia psidii MF-1 TaxID=1389203 RepID=A0A9Q3BQV1_9BASI|nr:hypothetical protein [Austropuccinia psidii MF-1]
MTSNDGKSTETSIEMGIEGNSINHHFTVLKGKGYRRKLDQETQACNVHFNLSPKKTQSMFGVLEPRISRLKEYLKIHQDLKLLEMNTKKEEVTLQHEEKKEELNFYKERQEKKFRPKIEQDQ